MINCGEAIDVLFYPKVFHILLNSKEEFNRLNAFDTISNMVWSWIGLLSRCQHVAQ